MSGYHTQYTTSQNVDFQSTVKLSMTKVANQIQGEAQGEMTLEQWYKRSVLCSNILGLTTDSEGKRVPGVDAWIGVFAPAVAQNPTIGDQTTWPDASKDGTIEAQVIAQWDSIAGVTGADLKKHTQ